MSSKTAIILGTGHIANRTKLLLTQKGVTVTSLSNVFSDLSGEESRTITKLEEIFRHIDLLSYNMTYVLFDRDEDNLEVVIAMTALYPSLTIATTFFNETIRPHLERANEKLIVVNPAKLAAPVFLDALEEPIVQHQKEKRPVDNDALIQKPALSGLAKLVSLFVAVILCSVIYFHFSEQLSWLDSVYFVVVTICTVGYGDINLLSSSATSKIIGILLILCSNIFIWLIFSLLVNKIVTRRTQLQLGRKKYRYKNHIIVCGLGRIGYFIALELQKRGEKIVVIELKQESANIDFHRSHGIDIYIGDARLPGVLIDAGVEQCRALISVVDDDYTNLEIGLTAKSFQPYIQIVLRIFDESMADIIKEKFDIQLTKSMSFIAAQKFASLCEPNSE